jgi:hypothetical protein
MQKEIVLFLSTTPYSFENTHTIVALAAFEPRGPGPGLGVLPLTPPMRPFPSWDRVRGLNISDCPSPESFTCPKGELLKCTEDDRARRIRMVAGCPSLVPPFFGQARKGAKRVFEAW